MKITRHIPVEAINSIIAKLFCKHLHTGFDDKQTLICHRCGTTWPISRALYEPTGVFARIRERIENEEEINRLIEMVEKYQAE